MSAGPTPNYPADHTVSVGDEPGLRSLLHRLNSQLGIIFAGAKLLDQRLRDDVSRSGARH